MTQNGHVRGYWIFQGSPSKYTLERNLASEASELWNLRLHSEDVRVGDRVYIWISGDDAGIYAVGTVMTAPNVRRDSPEGVRSWTDRREGLRLIARVEVRYDRILLDRPLVKPFLRADPILRDLTILRVPRMTNYPLSEAESAAIEEWIHDQN